MPLGAATVPARHRLRPRQAGWADVYSSNLSGQWIDITGVPAGTYVLEIVMDPMNLIDEADETNNTSRIHVTIP